MSITEQGLTAFSDQINILVSDNRRLHAKTEADGTTIRLLKEENAGLHVTIEEMTRHYRQRERELIADTNRAKVAYTEISGLLNQVAETVLQAARAQIGDQTPEKMPAPHLPHLKDDRLPIARLSS